jgi:hypothetical protein
MQSLLANTKATSSATQLAKTISVLDALIWIAEPAKQVFLQMVERCFQKARFSTSELNDDENDERYVKTLQESLNQTMYENVIAEYCLNTKAEKEANVKEINKFIDNHQQSKEEDDDGTSHIQLQLKFRICHNALNSITEL